MAEMRKLVVEEWAIGRLRMYEGNPRVNEPAVPKMVAALKEYGWRFPVLAKSDGEIVDGHLRYKAAKAMGLASVPVTSADDMTPRQVRAFRLLANRSATWAEWDDEMLAHELSYLAEDNVPLELTGFDEKDLERLLGENALSGASADGQPGIADVPLEESFWISVTGPAGARAEALALLAPLSGIPGVEVHSNLGDPKARGGRGA